MPEELILKGDHPTLQDLPLVNRKGKPIHVDRFYCARCATEGLLHPTRASKSKTGEKIESGWGSGSNTRSFISNIRPLITADEFPVDLVITNQTNHRLLVVGHAMGKPYLSPLTGRFMKPRNPNKTEFESRRNRHIHVSDCREGNWAGFIGGVTFRILGPECLHWKVFYYAHENAVWTGIQESNDCEGFKGNFCAVAAARFWGTEHGFHVFAESECDVAVKLMEQEPSGLEKRKTERQYVTREETWKDIIDFHGLDFENGYLADANGYKIDVNCRPSEFLHRLKANIMVLKFVKDDSRTAISNMNVSNAGLLRNPLEFTISSEPSTWSSAIPAIPSSHYAIDVVPNSTIRLDPMGRFHRFHRSSDTVVPSNDRDNTGVSRTLDKMSEDLVVKGDHWLLQQFREKNAKIHNDRFYCARCAKEGELKPARNESGWSSPGSSSRCSIFRGSGIDNSLLTSLCMFLEAINTNYITDLCRRITLDAHSIDLIITNQTQHTLTAVSHALSKTWSHQTGRFISPPTGTTIPLPRPVASAFRTGVFWKVFYDAGENGVWTRVDGEWSSEVLGREGFAASAAARTWTAQYGFEAVADASLAFALILTLNDLSCSIGSGAMVTATENFLENGTLNPADIILGHQSTTVNTGPPYQFNAVTDEFYDSSIMQRNLRPLLALPVAADTRNRHIRLDDGVPSIHEGDELLPATPATIITLKAAAPFIPIVTLASSTSSPFQSYTPKEFPGMMPTSALTEKLIIQGFRMPVRKYRDTGKHGMLEERLGDDRLYDYIKREEVVME
ncbi:hypothetical protein BC829DRAFT_443123 [Chytridium lagenaria]|nr:hypothetical protein BC829DRAFT_443123 [Chytridium lagenaria]